MAFDSLTATNGGSPAPLAGRNTAAGFVGAAALATADGAEVNAGNPLPVEIQGSIPVTIASAIEITNDVGNAIPVSAAALPLPAGAATELTAEAVTDLLQEVCIRLADIADSVGNLMPDTAGRIRVAAETLGTLSTITTVTTVATVGNMANQTNIGGFAATQHMMALTQMAEQALRQNIVIS